MKCPKCGYNSFEYLDSCKKCGNDLSTFKEAHGIRPIVIPPVVSPATVGVTSDATDSPSQPLPQEETFTWEEPLGSPPQIKAGDDIFTDLDLSFTDTPGIARAPSGVPKESPATVAATPVEGGKSSNMDLADFSFGETAPETTGELPSIFGTEGDEDGLAYLLETGDSSAETAAAPIPPTTPELESPWEAPANIFGSIEEEKGGGGGKEMDSFSWESPPEETISKPRGPKVEMEGFSPDELDSLFGEPEK